MRDYLYEQGSDTASITSGRTGGRGSAQYEVEPLHPRLKNKVLTSITHFTPSPNQARAGRVEGLGVRICELCSMFHPLSPLLTRCFAFCLQMFFA